MIDQSVTPSWLKVEFFICHTQFVGEIFQTCFFNPPSVFAAPKFRHSVCGSILSDSRSSKRPHSIISVSSSASSASSGSGSVNDSNRISNGNGHQDSQPSSGLVANLHNHRSKTNQSQCSAGNERLIIIISLIAIK